jgi:hypothetical protein
MASKQYARVSIDSRLHARLTKIAIKLNWTLVRTLETLVRKGMEVKHW